MSLIEIRTGPCLVGYLFTDRAEAIAKAVPVLVGTYADVTGLDVHHTEAQIVDCTMGARTWTEVRVAGTIVASWGPHRRQEVTR